MRYLRKCHHCEKEVTIEKPISEMVRVEHCAIRKSEFNRVYITTGDRFNK